MMPESPQCPVQSRIEDGVAILTLNRPRRFNALTRDMLILLHQRLSACAADNSIGAVILTGAGKAFCSGQDLAERDPRGRSQPFDLEAIQIELYHPILALIAGMSKPVVVAVNGLAAGAGSSLALAGDMVFAGRSARFIQSFVKIGLSVDAGGGWALAKAFGPARARGLLMTGGEIAAEEAERSGLIWRCVDDTDLLDTALSAARALAAGPRTALAGIKKAVAAAAGCDHALYLAEEARLQGEAGRDPNYAEGALAFLEKRAPRWV